MHLVLMGDSVFDNQAYVPDGLAAIDHLRASIGAQDTATLLAVDGDLAGHVRGQLTRLPPDATHLAISVGGNDALECLPTLERPVGGVMEALQHLSQIQASFATHYIQAMLAVSKLNLPTTVCTIYDDVPGLSAPLRTALSLFNDVIVRAAMRHGFAVLDLRECLTEPTDFSPTSPIEPSDIGGKKISMALLSRYQSGHR